jgi:hypothetical protein
MAPLLRPTVSRLSFYEGGQRPRPYLAREGEGGVLSELCGLRVEPLETARFALDVPELEE